MNVYKIITPIEEEMIRCACAKGAYHGNTQFFHFDNHQQYLPPAERISRATFTNAWMESFSLVM